MATEHDHQPRSANDEKKQGDFEIEDIGLEEATGGVADAGGACGSACNSTSCAPGTVSPGS
ncbi:MAG TPA: hypothetical protein VGM86_31430 [Thermoanaerobaculia bacterium]|jgi:hypothetical protein